MGVLEEDQKGAASIETWEEAEEGQQADALEGEVVVVGFVEQHQCS